MENGLSNLIDLVGFFLSSSSLRLSLLIDAMKLENNKYSIFVAGMAIMWPAGVK